MLSRRYLWLLVAIPIALLVLWATRDTGPQTDLDAVGSADIGGGLLYLSPASGPADLYHLDPDSGTISRLTEGAAITAFDIAASDAFLVFTAPNEAGGSHLWRYDLFLLESGLLLNCAPVACANPRLSPDGDLLAYESLAEGAHPEVWLLDLNTNQSERVSPSGQASHSPAWSPDGRLAYYNQDVGAYEVIQPGSVARGRFPNDTGASLTWAPDGESFVAAETFPASSEILRGPSGEAEFATPDPTTQAPVELLVGALIRHLGTEQIALFNYGAELIEDAGPSFSPDGRWLAFTRKYLDEARWTPGRQLWLLDVEAEEATPITDDPNYLITSLAWSPDSAQIAYVRSSQTSFNQPPEIWLINVDGTDARLLAVDAFAPQWLP